jgi:hypothetical protein
MKPKPQPKPEMEEVDETRLTEIGLLDPSIMLIEARKQISLLLARNTIIEQDRIQLQGARRIELPLGWKLVVTRLVSRFRTARLPDEFQMGDIDIHTHVRPAYCEANGEYFCTIENPSLLLPLSGPEYLALCTLTGRELHQWVARRFGIGTGLRAKPAKLPARRWAA